MFTRLPDGRQAMTMQSKLPACCRVRKQLIVRQVQLQENQIASQEPAGCKFAMTLSY